MTGEPMRDALAEGRVLPFRRRAWAAVVPGGHATGSSLSVAVL